jgi:hypothetical protein
LALTPLSVKSTPLGSGPDSFSVGLGSPEAVTVNELTSPRAKPIEAELEMDGAHGPPWHCVNCEVATARSVPPLCGGWA